MKITIDLCAGPYKSTIITKKDINKNIRAQKRAIDGECVASDFVNLIDTLSILEGIKENLT